MDQRLREVRKQVKRLFNPCKWQASGKWMDILVSLPYCPSQVGGLRLSPQGRQLCMPIITRWQSVSCSVMSNSLQPWIANLPGPSVHGILQARILEWLAISYSELTTGVLIFYGDTCSAFLFLAALWELSTPSYDWLHILALQLLLLSSLSTAEVDKTT